MIQKYRFNFDLTLRPEAEEWVAGEVDRYMNEIFMATARAVQDRGNVQSLFIAACNLEKEDGGPPWQKSLKNN